MADSDFVSGERTELKRLVSGCFMVGLPGPELDADTAEILRNLDPAGLILFGRNLVEPAQTVELLARSRALLTRPPLFAVDQEGGRVSRLAPWLGATPSAQRLAAAGEDAVREFGTATGAVVRSLGMNVDFAPVVDLCSAEATNGIGDRSFGTDSRRTARLAGAFLAGLQGQGVAGCLKHFPGLGDTSVDSHEVLPTVDRTRKELERADLLPYRELAGRAACVMVGHGHYLAIDGPDPLPATCSPNVVRGLLRDELGYAGPVVTDDLEMGAVAGRDADGSVAVETMLAGCDLLLFGSDLARAERAAAALAAAAGSRPALRQRLAEACARVAGLAARWPAPAGTSAQGWQRACGRIAAFRDLA